MNLFCSQPNFHYLRTILFPVGAFSSPGIKRETGENPVQSRCCELRKIVPISLLPLPVKGGKVIGRSESEDLQDKLTLICPRGKDAGRYLFFILFYANFSRAYACCSRACPMLAIFLFREGAER